jgi:hypothetical protein
MCRVALEPGQSRCRCGPGVIDTCVFAAGRAACWLRRREWRAVLDRTELVGARMGGERAGTSGSSDSARARSRAAWTTLPITAKRALARATTAHARTAGSAGSLAPPVTRQACTQFNIMGAALRRGNKNAAASRGAIGAFRMTKQQHSSSPRDPRRNLRPCRHWQWPAVPRLPAPLRTLRFAGGPWAGSGSLQEANLPQRATSDRETPPGRGRPGARARGLGFRV